MPPDDFFDGEWEEPSRTQETAPTRPAGEDEPSSDRPRRGARDRPSERRPSRPSRPAMPKVGLPASLEGLEWGRLAVLGAGIIVVVLVLVLLTRACGGSSATSKNQDYFNGVNTALKKSDAAGAQLHDLMRSQQPVKKKQLEAKLTTIRGESQAALTDATNLKPTKQIQNLQQYLLQTLSYRVNSIDCLIKGLPQAYKAKPASAGGAQLAPCMQRAMASDIVYTDSYSVPATKTLHDDNIDVQVPTSTFLSAQDAALVTPAGMTAVIQGWKPGSTAAGGLHGLKLDTVVARDSTGKTVTLQTGTVNKVNVHGLSFLVTATNGGNFTEYNIPVKLTIGEGKSAITKSATIDQISKGAQKTVDIGGFENTTLPFDKAIKVKVLVTPVPGERTASNNSGTYQVIFSL